MWDPLSLLGSYFKGLLEAVFEHFRDDAVAPALAGVLIAIGVGLILMLMARVVIRSWQIDRATAVVQLAKDRSEFARQFPVLDKRLDQNAALGHAWRSYKPTVIFPSLALGTPELRSTASAQLFFSRQTIGESWPIYRALPNLFVGAGLLLTFVGLVAALTFTTKAIGGAATSEQTQEALKDLLHAASFKFYTSIAGLLVSIALTMTLRCASASLEKRLSIFAKALEFRVHLVTVEEVALEQLAEAKRQTADIKLFNDEVAIQVGKQVELALNASLPPHLAHAMAPIAQAMERVTERIAAMSQTAVGGLAEEFSKKLQGNVGQEMRGIAELLGELRSALAAVNEHMAQTGTGLAHQVERIEKAIGGIDESARKVGEKLLVQVERAGAGAEAQIREASGGLAGMVADIGGNLSGTVAALTQALMTVSEEMRGVEARIAGHKDALEAISRSTREAGGLMTSAASTLRDASAPIAETGRSMGQATLRVQESLAAIEAMLQATRDDSHALGEQLLSTFETVQRVWADYEKRFGQVDESLAQAFERLTEQTNTSLSAINDYVVNLDKHLGLGIDRFSGAIEDLGDAASEFKQAANAFRR